jgi:bifunctional non-homologous end joining protein LigD
MKEYVIVGYTESEHGRSFSRIMFGEYKNGKLYYVHHSGGGISDKLLYSTFERLKPLEIKSKPVVNEADEETPIHWVKPVLVGQFKEKKLAKTRSASKRHPVIFLGIRDDKKSQDVVSDDEMNEQVETASQETHIKKPKKSTAKFDQVEVWKSMHKDEELQELIG